MIGSRLKPWIFVSGIALLFAMVATACAGEGDTSATGVLAKKVTSAATPAPLSTIAPDTSTHGQLGDGATPTPSQGQGAVTTPQPTPQPSPANLVAVTKVAVSPATFVTLYPPATDPSLSLGFTTSTKLTASVTLSNGQAGSYRWVDKSNGMLSVDAGGNLSVNAGTPPGVYTVWAQSVDDPSQYVAVTVEVLATTDVTFVIN